ncbi:MAG: FAD-linked oxidase C-terminal domain-containing protein [Anaerolineae bacterium]
MSALAELQQLLGDRVTVNMTERERHSHDESSFTSAPPDAVCFPCSTAEAAEVVRICRAHRRPVIPFGVGSSLEGHTLPIRGGICVDMSLMNRVLAIRPDDMDCTVEAGLTRQELNEAARKHGLFFPIDPGANATLGGMTATRASGTNAVRYGTMRDNVLALTVVLASGEVIHTGSRARKSSAGYDLTRLFVGSEGTLGIITEVTLRLYPVPEAISAAVVSFPTVDDAVAAVTETMQSGIPVARIELLDDTMLGAVNAFAGLTYPVQPTLFLEFHGSVDGVAEQARQTGEIMQAHGGGDFNWATHEEDRQRLWKARHNAYFAALALRPGARAISTDVCVPISRLTECIHETKLDLANTFLLAPMVGHVGDGNFHLLILIDPSNPDEVAEANRLNERLVRRALAMEGTSTGEHGVGIGKAKFMRAEHGSAVEVMRSVKLALDPLNLMNPGKILPPV